MRTTVTIDENLYRRAKSQAARTGRSVSQLIEDALREALRPSHRQKRELPPLPTFGGSGLLPGVDLSSNAALRDRMDESVAVDALR